MEGSVTTNLLIQVAVPVILIVGPGLILAVTLATHVWSWAQMTLAQLPH